MGRSTTVLGSFCLACACGAPQEPPPAAPASAALAEDSAVLPLRVPAGEVLPAPPGGAVRAAAGLAPGRPQSVVVRVSPLAARLLGEGFEEAFEQDFPGFGLELHRSSDRGGIDEVAGRRADAAVVAADPSPAEQALGVVGATLGDYAAALVVHAGSPVRSLGEAFVRDLLVGQAVAWERISYHRGPVELLLGPEGDVDQRLAALLIPGDRFAGAAERFENDAAVLAALARRPAGVGVVGLAALERQSGVRALAIDGVAPDRRTVRAGRYPHRFAVQLVWLHPERPGVRALRAFAESARGRGILGAQLLLR